MYTIKHYTDVKTNQVDICVVMWENYKMYFLPCEKQGVKK